MKGLDRYLTREGDAPETRSRIRYTAEEVESVRVALARVGSAAEQALAEVDEFDSSQSYLNGEAEYWAGLVDFGQSEYHLAVRDGEGDRSAAILVGELETALDELLERS